jgi:hypothetical protein
MVLPDSESACPNEKNTMQGKVRLVQLLRMRWKNVDCLPTASNQWNLMYRQFGKSTVVNRALHSESFDSVPKRYGLTFSQEKSQDRLSCLLLVL